jgi:choline-glycine betaine transporter
MTADQLSATAGVVLSLGFSYVPGVNDWFESLKREHKQALMGALLVVVSAAVFGVSCSGVVDVGIECSQDGAVGLAQTLIAALVANQSAYLITRD